MLKIALVIFSVTMSVALKAQWIPQSKPFHKKDFSKIAAGKYTMAFEYKLEDSVKTLTSVVEYGAQGLPAALFQKGTNDNGDSVNIAETLYRFDGIGRLVRESNADLQDGENWDKLYSYSKNDRLIKSVSLHIDPTTTIYSYDSKGRLLKTFTTVRMPLANEEGKITGKAVEIPNERKSFMYDKGGRLTEEKIYYLRNGNDGNKWSYKTKRTYNSTDQLVKFERMNSEGLVYNTETYEYDTNGLLIKRTEKGDEEPLHTFLYEYCSTCKQSWLK